MDREERLAKNRAVLAALSIPSLAAETRETPDEIGDGSRRRGRAAASTSTAPSRRSSRAEARKVKTYADEPGEDWGDRASGESDAGSDSGRARAEEAADADFRGSESESEATRSETGGSEEDDEDDACVARARGDTPEILELDEDGEEVGGEAKERTSEGGDDASETEKTKARRRRRRPAMENDADADARDAFLAFGALRLGGRAARVLKPEDATFGLRELRAVVDAHGFEDRQTRARAHARAGGGGTTPTRERRRRRRGGGGDRPERRRRAAARGGGGSGGRGAPGRLRPRAARGDRGRAAESDVRTTRVAMSLSRFSERERTRTLLPTCRTSGLSIVKDVVFERLSHRNRNRKALFSVSSYPRSSCVLGCAVVPAPHAPVVGPRLRDPRDPRCVRTAQSPAAREYGNACRSRRGGSNERSRARRTRQSWVESL